MKLKTKELEGAIQLGGCAGELSAGNEELALGRVDSMFLSCPQQKGRGRDRGYSGGRS